MTLDELPDWDCDPLEKWQPTAAQRARALELWALRAADNPNFAAMFNGFCDDVLTERALPQALLAVIDHGTTSLIGAQGQDLTVKRLAADVEAARADIIEFGSPT